MLFPRILAAALLPLCLGAAVPTMPLADIKAGMRGTGRTVFKGAQPENFDVEILGILENIGPKQSIILARLSGGPLEKTGVMQGMSGSPVYIDGKLIGAVALTFQFSKEPIAGIRPIREMLDVDREPATRHLATARAHLPSPGSQPRLVDIATPVSFNGFTRATLDQFAPQLRVLGFDPVQGVSSGGTPATGFGDPSLVQPGSMISVQLLSGDMSVGAEGTITAIDGKNIYGFGHRFLSVGPTDLPFARAEVIALLPNVATSFKISAAREWMGTITQDRSVGIAGALGRQAQLVPFSISVKDDSKTPRPMRYRMQMVNDRTLAPLLVQMAVYSAIEATERTLGTGSFRVKGHIAFDGSVPPIQINNLYAGDFNAPLQVSLGTATPLSYIMQSGFEGLKLKNIQLEVEASDRKKQLAIDQVWTSTREVHPGDSFEVITLLTGDAGVEFTRKVQYTVPVGASPGPIYITVADGSSTNLNEYQQYIGAAPRTPSQLIGFLNGFRPNNRAYVRLWRADTAFTVQGMDLPDTPPSVSMLLAKTQASFSGGLWRGSKVAEFDLPTGDAVVTGSKTIQVDVKE